MESFNNVILIYCPKRIHFADRTFDMRIALAVLDWVSKSQKFPQKVAGGGGASHIFFGFVYIQEVTTTPRPPPHPLPPSTSLPQSRDKNLSTIPKLKTFVGWQQNVLFVNCFIPVSIFCHCRMRMSTDRQHQKV